MSKTPEYKSWSAMHARCKNPKHPAYERYRHIEIRYKSFEDFLDDVGPRPAAGYTIDRIDNEGNYERGNCRWADKKTQANNITRKPPTTIGKTYHRLTVTDEVIEVWNGRNRRYCVCKCECGNEAKVRKDSLEKGNIKSCGCLQKEGARLVLHTFRGKTQQLKAWAKELDMLYETLASRIYARHWSTERAFTTEAPPYRAIDTS